MARSAASKAETAAAALHAFLHTRRGMATDAGRPMPSQSDDETAPVTSTAPAASSARLDAATVVSPDQPSAGAPLQLPHTDWLHHGLVVTGDAVGLDAFRKAASGAGVIPWHLDLDIHQEDWFHRLLDPADRTLSLTGARLLAAQLREAVERRHALAVSRVGRSQACPFDLHALLPVPVAILRLGPDHPDALAWLRRHWGTTEALRHVALAAGGKRHSSRTAPAEGEVLRLSFWSADWTPWRAIEQIRSDWPGLQFDVQPKYALD